MALSESVAESVDEAASQLRNALARAARNEHPMVLEQLSKLVADLNRLKAFDKFHDQLEKLTDEKGDNPFQSFFQ